MARRTRRTRRYSGLAMTKKQRRVAALGVASVGTLVLGWWALAPSDEPRGAALITLPGTKQDFVAQMYPAIAAAAPNTSLRTKFLILAHAAYESGWGSGKAFKGGWNPFNITAGSAGANQWWPGTVIQGPDTEYGRKITQNFRSYPDLTAAVGDYLNFLGNANGGRYASAYSKLLAGDPTFVTALGQAGYYTLPTGQYQSAFLSVLKSCLGAAQGLVDASPDDVQALVS